MLTKADFLKLHDKLKKNTLSKTEYNQFLEFVNSNLHLDFVRETLSEGYPVTSYAYPSKKRYSIAFWNKIAAVFILGWLVSYFVWNSFSSKEQVLYRYTASEEPSTEIILPDKSKVKLNSFSELLWIKDFNNSRHVKLKGEAYFDVVHTNKNEIFIVETSTSKISVLGTSFNVTSRGKIDKVFLKAGKVELEKKIKGEPLKAILHPGESAVLEHNRETINVVKAKELKDEAEWKDGLLRFSDIKVSEIINRLEEIYDKDILFDDPQLLNKKLELTLPYGNWNLSRSALALALGLEKIDYTNREK